MARRTDTRNLCALIYDDRMTEHSCSWDPEHPESPRRFTAILDRVRQSGLHDRCFLLPPRAAKESELLGIHTKKHVYALEALKGCKDYELIEHICSRFDSIFINEHTYDLAMTAAGCAIDLVKEVVTGKVRSGLAIVRPPGHHAMSQEYCGYCFFNNVAVAAKYAVDSLHLKRVLIVDWDVHHGQATQQAFYADSRVLYFSIHRYDEGEFWPELQESNWDHIGEGEGIGFNVNVPLNATNLDDWDYAAIFHQVLLPLVFEYRPQLILVSAGFDAALGDPEGDMRVTPAMFGHMLHLIRAAAEAATADRIEAVGIEVQAVAEFQASSSRVPIAVVLEGGYCIPALSESVCHVLRLLCGDPCARLLSIHRALRRGVSLAPKAELVEIIRNCVAVLKPYWRCFWQETPLRCDLKPSRFKGTLGLHKPSTYPTRYDYKRHTEDEIQTYAEELEDLKKNTVLITAAAERVKIVESLDEVFGVDVQQLRKHLCIVAVSNTADNLFRVLTSGPNVASTSPLLLLFDFDVGRHDDMHPAFSLRFGGQLIAVNPRRFQLKSAAEAVAVMYSLLLPIYYMTYPDWVIITTGNIDVCPETPESLLMSLCVAHLSCEGALWVIDNSLKKQLNCRAAPVTAASTVPDTGVDGRLVQQLILEASAALGLKLDIFANGTACRKKRLSLVQESSGLRFVIAQVFKFLKW